MNSRLHLAAGSALRESRFTNNEFSASLLARAGYQRKMRIL